MKLPWTDETASAIGADWLLAAIAPAGAFGRAARARERAFRRGDEAAARAALARVAAVAHAYPAARLRDLRATIASAPDIREALGRARGGTTLDDVDFFEILRFVDTIAAFGALARDGAGGTASLAIPVVSAHAGEQLARGRTNARTFYLDDAFAPELARSRGVAASAQATFDSARGRLEASVARALGRETLGDDAFTVARDALPQPLPTGLRVLREAPTYVVCALELDDASRAALAARDDAANAVAFAEEAVRVRLTRVVAAAARELERACEIFGEAESSLARAEFARRHACVVPDVAETRAIALEELRYLPLVDALATHERAYEPLDLALDGIGVVTGPNMGGKTATLRALGFAVACVALGVPVPARSASVPLVDEIVWLGIEARPAGDALLSSFGREIVGARELLDREPPRALVLLDEFARTTSPREGRALLVALLATLAERGAFGLAATHLAGIASDAGLAHYALGGLDAPPQTNGARLSLDDALARIARMMAYRLERVDEDASPAMGALALAEALGLDAAVVARAQRALER